MKDDVIEAIAGVCKQLFDSDVAIEIERPDEQFGDWACNVAMRLAKPLGENPRNIAQSVAEKLNESEMFESVGVAGPGFINMTLADNVLLESLDAKQAEPLNGLKVLVEYSDPNPFKPLHAGHLYTTLVGDVIARLVENAGAKTIRLNYGGDVGLHVAKSMWAIVEYLQGELPEKLNEIPEDSRAEWLGERYVEGNNAYEENETARAEIVETNKAIYKVQAECDRETGFAKIYWTCREWSYSYFKELYNQLEVHEFDRFIPESEVTQTGIDTVQKQLQTGVYEQSDGAVIFDGEKFGLHKRVFLNSEGLPTYETKDVGLSLTKWRDYKFDESVIITANEQAQYMEVVIKSIEQFEPEPAEKTRHITHGVLKMSGGVKMSSRKGNVLLAMDMLEAARKAGMQSGSAKDEATVLAALKYAMVKNRIGGDVVYDPEESVAMEGNSGPYLQYAHARACSILGKAKNAPNNEFLMHDYKLNESERSLVRILSQFNEVIEQSTVELAPHHICTYLFELAQNFNRFYEKNKVIGTEQESPRISLVGHYKVTLEKGLSLLGITAPESM